MPILILALTTLIASVIGTFTGFGISTIMVPVVLLFLPLPQTLLLVGVIHWFGDIWKMLLFRHGIKWRILLLFGLPAVITSYLGASLVLKFPETLLSQIVGLVLAGYAVFLLVKPNFEIKPNNFSALTGGAISGFTAGLTGVAGGAIRGLFLVSYNLPKAIYIFTSGALGFATDLTRIATYFGGGIKIENNLLLGMLLFIPLSFVGARLGKSLVNKVNTRTFRTIIAIFIGLIGFKLLLFPGRI